MNILQKRPEITGKVIADQFVAEAEVYFGYHPPRAALNQKTFTAHSATFKSLEEARNTSMLFKERHGSELYEGRPGHVLSDLAKIIAEIRGLHMHLSD